MKIVIHGTKGGYHIFNAERIPGFIDARPDYNKVAAIGQEAYAVNFNSNYVILSKYRIIRDVPGEKRTGNIAYSLVIANNKKLAGSDVKVLLDKIADKYYSEYIKKGDNLENVREDWTFVEELTKEYESRLRPVPADDIELIQPGSAEAAFIYYTSDQELEKYLDEPFQVEYRKFKQIFFVKSDLKDQAENPLNALRHNPTSNLTGQIDLKNPKYTLNYNEYAMDGVKIEVFVNGLKCNNKSKIPRKSDLEISYSKQYYNRKSITSKWNEVNTEYVDVNDAAQTITIREISLTPKTQTITIDVKDHKKRPLIDAEIFCENYLTKEKKKVINNEIVFKAEELKDKWTVWGKKNNLSGLIDFIPENQPASVALVLAEHKTVKITASDQDNGDMINGIVIEVSQKLRSRGSEIEFVGDDIYEKWVLTISHDDYERKTFSYCPATDDNPKNVRLKKLPPSNGGGKNKKYYNVSAGNHGKLKDGNMYTSERRDGHDVKDRIVPNKGYEFAGFELDDNTLTALYRKKEKESFFKNPIFFAIIVLSVIVLFSAYKYGLFNLSPKDKSEEIITYCDGIVLSEQILNEFKETNCTGSKQPVFCKKIDSAIDIRTAITQGNIDQLKRKKYSITQDTLRKAINSINPKFIDTIGETLKTYPTSDLDLVQVADVIVKLQKLLLINVNGLHSEQECDERIQQIAGWGLRDVEIVKSMKDKINAKKEKIKKVVNDDIVDDKPNPDPTPDTHKTDPPIRTQAGSGKSQLENKFWDLVKKGNEQKDSYGTLLKNYNSRNASPADVQILNYLKAICKDSESFLKFKRVPLSDRISATKLSDISIDKNENN